MPLILLTGLPSSGKSTLAVKLSEELNSRLKANDQYRTVRIVSDTDQLEWDGRNDIYNSIAKEKELRGWIRSEAQRYINLNNIVILDVAAYIKGFRYELYCISKEAKTQYCVVERLLDPEICWKWNEELLKEHSKNQNEIRDDDNVEPGYSKAIFDALCMRYEKCDDNNRWDSPLFRLESVDTQLDYDKIYDIVTIGVPLMSNKCTSLMQTTNSIFKENRDKSL